MWATKVLFSVGRWKLIDSETELREPLLLQRAQTRQKSRYSMPQSLLTLFECWNESLVLNEHFRHKFPKWYWQIDRWISLSRQWLRPWQLITSLISCHDSEKLFLISLFDLYLYLLFLNIAWHLLFRPWSALPMLWVSFLIICYYKPTWLQK